MTVGRVGQPERVASGTGSSGTGSHIKVVVRIRPENQQEINGGYKVVVHALDEHMLIFDPKEEGSPGFYHGRRRRGRDLLRKANKDIRFAFDSVFAGMCTNQEVYENTTKEILDGLLDGYNCSVFAYGATGAGKTFTMLGSLKCPGVIFLTMMELYERIDAMKEEKTCDVAVSYMEVYNEQIRDLLTPGPFLPIREDPQKGVIVNGLSLHKPTSAEELFHMLEFGNRHRTQHPTDANAESSRSHAVFQVFVRQRDRTAGLSANVCVGKMSLIDLAGSERATVTKNRGARFREGANINRSLLALGNCINALADGKSKGYVPYRNSKLTRLLKDSLGGNCRTVMIAAVSPSAMTYEDTYNTLKYANRAKAIKANLKKNVMNVDFHVAKYAKIVEELRTEVQELKDKLQKYECGSVIKDRRKSIDVSHQQELDRLQDGLYRTFQQRSSIRKELMELEGKGHDMTYRIHRKELRLARQQLISLDHAALEKANSRVRGFCEATQKRRHSIIERKNEVEKRMGENEECLKRSVEEINVYSRGEVPELLEYQLRCHHLEIELRDTRRQGKFLKKLCRIQQQEANSSEKLMHNLLATVKRQYLLLKSHGLATSDVVSDFQALCHQTEGEREIAWADQSSMEAPDVSMCLGSDTGLDIGAMTSFPVLSCVSLTPKHPCRGRNLRGDRTPAQTPGQGTPGSARRRKTTPRRLLSSGEPGGMTPAPTAERLGAIQEQSTESDSNQEQAPKAELCAGSCTVNAGRTPCPKGSSGESLAAGSGSCNHTQPLPSCMQCSAKNTCSQSSTNSSQSHRQSAISPGPLQSGLNSTFTCAEDGVFPLDSSDPGLGSMGSNTGDCTAGQPREVQDQTVVISTPHVPKALHPHVDLPAHINSSTITKTKVVDENTPPPNHRQVARAMDFENMPCQKSPGRLSFAEIVKSPAPFKPIPRVTAQEESSRSPLMSRENLPPHQVTCTANRPGPAKLKRSHSVSSTRVPSASKQVQFAPASSNHFKQPLPATNMLRRHSEYQRGGRVADTLRRVGLPSVMSRLKSTSDINEVPSYMRSTKAASRRNRNHRRSMSAEGHGSGVGPQRVPVHNKENKANATRVLSKSRSKSTAQLHKHNAFM